MGKPNKENFRAYWNLDEASGNAIDALGNHDLTETSGTIASAEGGRDFEAGDTEYFIMASHADVAFADEPFTVGAWVKPESQPAVMRILSKLNTGAGKREYRLDYNDVNDRYDFGVSPAGGTPPTIVTANNYGAVPATTRAFVLAWHDPNADKIYIQVDNGTPDEASYSLGCNAGTADFILGCYLNQASPSSFYDGIMWSAFVYAGVMTADERTAMYNGGTPLKWIDFGPPNVKTINGVAIGSAKTVSGISVASIKSIQGIT